MNQNSYYMINAITLYRMVAAPLLIYLVFIHQFDVFKWLLAASFLTDAIDGYLARRYKIASVFGARIDSVADDLTIAAAILGMYVRNAPFFSNQILSVVILIVLYFLQNATALIKYGRTTSFHTYLAKIAAVLQGLFIIAFFFLRQPLYWLFCLTVFVTVMDLIEETIMIMVIPEFRTDVKGLYWLKKEKES